MEDTKVPPTVRNCEGQSASRFSSRLFALSIRYGAIARGEADGVGGAEWSKSRLGRKGRVAGREAVEGIVDRRGSHAAGQLLQAAIFWFS